MSSNNTNNNPINGLFQLKPDASLLGKVKSLLSEIGHIVLKFYFSILLMVYFGFVKIFAVALQPFRPLLEQMGKIPQKEATVDGIVSQFGRLVGMVLVYLTPFITKVITFLTRPLAWARDQLVEYVEQDEKAASSQTSQKER